MKNHIINCKKVCACSDARGSRVCVKLILTGYKLEYEKRKEWDNRHRERKR